MASSVGNEVCVVGAGVFGLVAVKNLDEQGLKVTAFEKHAHLGGLWHASDDPNQTTVLDLTSKNTSKQMVSPDAGGYLAQYWLTK